jgi:glycosyltransferase involved in cell wall biosynthesis
VVLLLETPATRGRCNTKRYLAPRFKCLCTGDAWRLENTLSPPNMTVSANTISSPSALSSPGVKVMHVRASNFFGGPEKQIIEHLRLLRRTQAQPLLCSFCEKGGETELAARAKALGIRSFSIPCLGAYDPAQLVRLRRLFNSERPELVCTHDYRSTFLCFIGRAGLPIKQIAFWRGTTRENLKVALYYKIENCLLRRMDHVVVVSKQQRNFLTSHGFSENGVSLVSNAVEIEQHEKECHAALDERQAQAERLTKQDLEEQSNRLATLFAKLRGKTIIATAGRLSPEKGHKYLIEAMPRVLANKKDAVLLLFGDGPLRNDLARLAEKVGCADSIHLLGFVPGFSSFLKDVDLFVLPSLIEGFPNALLEALAAAKPVVATAVGGVPEIVSDGKTGVLISPGDSGLLAAAIINLLSDAGLARAMGEAGKEAVRKSYSFEKQLQLLIDVYSKTLAGEKG